MAKLSKKITADRETVDRTKEYALADAKRAHEDLEARKLTGPAILIP